MEQILNETLENKRYEEVLSVNRPVFVFAVTVAALIWFGMISWTHLLTLSSLGILFAYEIFIIWKKYLFNWKELESETQRRKTAETALMDSEEIFRTFMENSPDGISIIRGGVFLCVNPRHAAIFGYDSGDDILYRSIISNVHPDDSKRVKEIILSMEKGKPPPLIFEFRGLHKNGRIVRIEISCAMTKYHGEKAVIAFTRDVTGKIIPRRAKINIHLNTEEGRRLKKEVYTIRSNEINTPVNEMTNGGIPDAATDSADLIHSQCDD